MDNCDRCNKELHSFTMSWFNTDNICMDCSKIENNHPDVKFAKEIEGRYVKARDMKYPGIGWPGENGRVDRSLFEGLTVEIIIAARLADMEEE